MEQNETGTQNPAKPSNSTAGLLARVVKGVVSFLQNLLSPQTQKEGVRCGQVSAFFQLAAAVVVGIGLLVGSNAEAQSPDIEFYGVDTHYEFRYFNGQWHESRTDINQIYMPGRHSAKGLASSRFANPLQCGSTFFPFLKSIYKRTIWYHSGAHRDQFDYEVQCINGQLQKQDYLVGNTNSTPVLYLDNKAMIVGRIERPISSVFKSVDQHLTQVLLTATHTSGTKNFTVLTKYRIEGGAIVVSHSQSVVLKPGQKKRISLFVPVGNWATIDSVTATQNRPHPAPPPAPPVFIAPVPVPRPVPVPAPPTSPRRPRR